jgi:hypothetical protein
MLVPNRTYLGLAAHRDRRIYLLYDGGFGPAIEEWRVPYGGSNVPWSVVGSVAVNATMSGSTKMA